MISEILATAAVQPVTFSLVVVAIIVILPIGGFIGGFLVQKLVLTPPQARKVASAMRQGKQGYLLGGHDGRLRFIDFGQGGVTGYLHGEHVEAIPDKGGMYNWGGASIGFATAETVSNVRSDFLEWVETWRKGQKDGKLTVVEGVLGHKIGTTPEELAKGIYEIKEKEDNLKKMEGYVKQLNSGETTTAQLAVLLKIPKEAYADFATDMESYQKENGAKIKGELDKIKVACDITADQTFQMKIEGDKKNGFKFLFVRTVHHTLDEFWHLLPTGSSMLAVWNMVKRAEIANRLEQSNPTSKYQNLVLLGVFVMLISIGAGLMVYLSTGK